MNCKNSIVERIKVLCKEKNAIILAHYYTRDEVQQIADFLGDSLALAQKAARTDADIIVMCGVKFMAETCKLLCPEKKVLIPDINAECSLAESCKYDELKKFIENYPNHKVVSYVNTTADVKSLSYICVTSGNAKKIIDSLDENEKIIFCPDYNLGSYINKVTGRQMILWKGGCHVHSRFSAEELKKTKKENARVKVLAHPECKQEILDLSDFIGSTAAMIDYVGKNSDKEFIVVTEPGILYELKNKYPDKTFITVSSEECSCNECEYMKFNTLEKILSALENENPMVEVDKEISELAVQPIKRMLDI